MPDLTAPGAAAAPTTRRRLTKSQRYDQLIAAAWQLIAAEGTDALTLGRLAEVAGITKPVVYEHFGTRHGLLAALWQDFDRRQNRLIDERMAAAAPDLSARAQAIVSSYISCVLTEGREIPEVLAALSGSPELAALRKACLQVYLQKCRQTLAPFSGPGGLSDAALWAVLGAADALSAAALSGEISEQQAGDELYAVIVAMVERSQ